jgi:hypothetical protein
LSPVVNNKTHHFAARGLYNGLVLLGDRETGSFWDHITGKCVHGPLKGYQLEIFPLLHMNVNQALATHPDTQIAISRQLFKHRVMANIAEWRRKSKWGWIPPYFVKTMGKEDRRRPRMEIGLGVWKGATHRYYPLKTLRAHDSVLFDKLNGRRLLVYIDPITDVPAALYTDALQVAWQNDTLRLDTGETIRGGVLYDTQGVARAVTRPMQLFTRWYGFAYTFPGCELYEG